MLEGNDVRISGQDVGRGTFSHRHAMLVDQKTEGVIVSLNDELNAPGKLELANSKHSFRHGYLSYVVFVGSLSEMAVLGVCLPSITLSLRLIYAPSSSTEQAGKGQTCYRFGRPNLVISSTVRKWVSSIPQRKMCSCVKGHYRYLCFFS